MSSLFHPFVVLSFHIVKGTVPDEEIIISEREMRVMIESFLLPHQQELSTTRSPLSLLSLYNYVLCASVS